MTLDRRQFVSALLVSGAAAAVPTPSIDRNPVSLSLPTSPPNPPNTNVDFRYAPHHQQSTICFPDDPKKTIVDQAGDLRYVLIFDFISRKVGSTEKLQVLSNAGLLFGLHGAREQC